LIHIVLLSQNEKLIYFYLPLEKTALWYLALPAVDGSAGEFFRGFILEQ